MILIIFSTCLAIAKEYTNQRNMSSQTVDLNEAWALSLWMIYCNPLTHTNKSKLPHSILDQNQQWSKQIMIIISSTWCSLTAFHLSPFPVGVKNKTKKWKGGTKNTKISSLRRISYKRNSFSPPTWFSKSRALNSGREIVRRKVWTRDLIYKRTTYLLLPEPTVFVLFR